MRINVIPVRYLTDEHLIAEWNEHHMLPFMLKRSLLAHDHLSQVIAQIPIRYTLNKGHGYFFYNKLRWVNHRRVGMFDEMTLRGFRPNAALLPLKLDGIPVELEQGVWRPDMTAMEVNLERIEERIAKKPRFYSWYHRGQRDWVKFYEKVREELRKNF